MRSNCRVTAQDCIVLVKAGKGIPYRREVVKNCAKPQTYMLVCSEKIWLASFKLVDIAYFLSRMLNKIPTEARLSKEQAMKEKQHGEQVICVSKE